MNLTPYQEIKEFMNAYRLADKKKKNMQEERYISDQLYNMLGVSLRVGALALMCFTCSEGLGITNFGTLGSAVNAKESFDFSRTCLSHLPVEQASLASVMIGHNLLWGMIYTFGCLVSTITQEQPEIYKDIRDIAIKIERESNES